MAQEQVEVPIAGKILSVDVQDGADVQEGDVLCVLESMKMENPILAPIAGKVSGVSVSPGQVVEVGNIIAVIEY